MRRAGALLGTILAAALGTAAVLALPGCSGDGVGGRPLATPLSAIQSGTVRIALHQVMVLTLSDDQHYTAQVADPSVVSVVEHRDAAVGRFEPELVPLRAGSTQVALTGSTPGEEVVGFRVIVTAPPTTRADRSR